MSQSIYNYVFHYNHFEELWYAIPRDRYLEYWSMENKSKTFQSDISIKKLLEKVTKNSKK